MGAKQATIYKNRNYEKHFIKIEIIKIAILQKFIRISKTYFINIGINILYLSFLYFIKVRTVNDYL